MCCHRRQTGSAKRSKNCVADSYNFLLVILLHHMHVLSNHGSPRINRGGFIGTRGSHLPNRGGFVTRGSPLPNRGGFVNRGSPVPNRGGFVNRGSPLPNRGGFGNRGNNVRGGGHQGGRGGVAPLDGGGRGGGVQGAGDYVRGAPRGGGAGRGARDRQQQVAQQRQQAYEQRRRADDAVRAAHVAAFQANQQGNRQREERADDPEVNPETALLGQYLVARSQQPAEPDGFHHFAMMVAYVLRQIPPRNASNVMLKIGKLLNDEWEVRFPE
ncbi:hypothetical protein FOCC_FOCC015266 [Frankliniella occidentalis]|nr:hypothetical protein FOCC_FOCC015266 [Frankliniella occidentalis]